MTQRARALASVVATVAAVVAAAMTTAAPAQATAYRYWSYWIWSGDFWQYSSQGPSASVHAGETIGWRFAVQTDSADAMSPRVGPPACDEATQVGVSIDYGTTQDAPPGEQPPSPALQQTCVSASANRTGYQATNAAAPIRTNDSGLVCGIDGYPKTECAPIVSTPASPTSAPTTKASAPTHPVRTHQAAPLGPAPRTTQTARPGPATRSASSQPTGSPPVPIPSSSVLVSTTAPARPSSHAGFPIALLAGSVLIAALAGAAVWRYRTTR